MSNSAFQEIDVWEKENVLSKFTPKGAKLVKTNDSNIILIIGGDNDKFSSSITLLDRLASLVHGAKTRYFKLFGKRMIITKDEAQELANVLNEQSKKLEAMAQTYKLMATALLIKKDEFVEIVKNADKHIDDIMSNPF